MKPRLLETPPTAALDLRVKFDGIRLLGVKNGDKVKSDFADGNELRRVPEVADAVRAFAD